MNDATDLLGTALLAFVRVAELRSFTKAAHELGITASAVSKAISRMETRLGVQLLQRTTRSVSLTEDGAAYADRCRQLLHDFEEADAIFSGRQLSLKGRLRVQLPAAEGRSLMLPTIVSFLKKYPQLSIDIDLSGRSAALADEAVDIAVRIGSLPDSGFIARKICDLQYMLCASPSYLAREGTPRSAADLAKHRCLAYVSPMTGRLVEWPPILSHRKDAARSLGGLTANGSQVLIDAAVAGGGIVLAASTIVEPLVQAGKLCTVLDTIALPMQPMYVLYLPHRHVAAKIRLFAEHSAQAFSTAQPTTRHGTAVVLKRSVQTAGSPGGKGRKPP